VKVRKRLKEREKESERERQERERERVKVRKRVRETRRERECEREGEGPRERRQTETASPWARTWLGLVLTPSIKIGKSYKITPFSWKEYYNCSLFICYSGLALGGGEERAVCYMLFMDLTLQLGIGGSCHSETWLMYL
jgi:hypothetical protein